MRRPRTPGALGHGGSLRKAAQSRWRPMTLSSARSQPRSSANRRSPALGSGLCFNGAGAEERAPMYSTVCTLHAAALLCRPAMCTPMVSSQGPLLHTRVPCNSPLKTSVAVIVWPSPTGRLLVLNNDRLSPTAGMLPGFATSPSKTAVPFHC